MKLARIIVLLVAIIAGGLAALLVGGRQDAPAPKVVEQTPMSEVLVAASDIPMGQVVGPGSLQWRAWPQDGTSTRRAIAGIGGEQGDEKKAEHGGAFTRESRFHK